MHEVDGNEGIDEDVSFGDENAVHSKTTFRIVGYQDWLVGEKSW